MSIGAAITVPCDALPSVSRLMLKTLCVCRLQPSAVQANQIGRACTEQVLTDNDDREYCHLNSNGNIYYLYLPELVQDLE